MDPEQNAGSSNTDTSTSGSEAVATGEAGTILSTGESNQGQGSGEAGKGEISSDATGEGESGDKGGKQAEGEGKDGGKEGEGVPESYDFTMPEGFTLDETTASAASEVFKKHGFSQEVASELTQVVAEQRQREAEQAAEAAEAAFAKQLDDWKTELKNDPDFGGDNFDENSGKVAAFVEATVPDGIKEEVMSFFVTTGAGNHPGLVKYIHHLSGLMPVGEDQPGSSQGSGISSGKTRAERMYPND